MSEKLEKEREEERSDLPKTIIKVTEQTVKELLWAIEKSHKEITFTDEPWPTDDVEDSEFEKLRQRKGYILVKSYYSDIEFLISLETKPQSQESLGYNVEIIDIEPKK